MYNIKKKTKEGGIKNDSKRWKPWGCIYIYTYTICLEDRVFASFLCSKFNLILVKIINRVKFVYLFELQDAV